MRLIRLTTSDPLGIFNNSFNSTITIKPKSKICLTSLTSEEAVEGLTINDSNDTVRVQLSTAASGGIGVKTIKLTHAVYKDTNFDLFFTDFTNKLNQTIIASGAGLGYEYKVGLDNSGRVSILGKRSSYNTNAIPVTSWIKNSVKGDSTVKRIYSSTEQPSTSTNEVNMGLEQLFCNGGGVFSCRINTLINGINDGFIMGLTKIDPSTDPNYTDEIIEHAISVGSVSGTYSYYHKGTLNITAIPIGYNNNDSTQNPVLSIQLTDNKYKYVVYNLANKNGVELFSIDKIIDDENKLYPFIIFKGGMNNVSVDSVKYTPSPFNLTPYNEKILNIEDPITELSASPSQSKRPTLQFIEFVSLALTNYLGFSQQINPQPVIAVSELDIVSSGEFVPTSFTDSFLVELLNLTVDSYDGSINGRRNLLAVIPQSYNEKQQIVYQASTLMWIDLLNAFPIDLREMKMRLVRDDNSPLQIRGISTAVIMIKDENE